MFGHITKEQFQELSAGYQAEQKELETLIPEKEAKIEKLQESVADVAAFIGKAKKYTEIKELTPELLRLFIKRIEIGEKNGRNEPREVKIFYRDIGLLDTPMQDDEVQPRILPPFEKTIATQQLPAVAV